LYGATAPVAVSAVDDPHVILALFADTAAGGLTVTVTGIKEEEQPVPVHVIVI